MIRGSCLCGTVRYEIHGPLGPITHCHCSQCRKAHGAAFGSYARVQAADFRWIAGQDSVAAYRSSPDVQRAFCGNCGSRLQFLRDSRPQGFSIAVGTLDDDPGSRPLHRIFTGSKAPWFDPDDALPRHDARPPAAA
jgi:hypothetical protein